MKYLILILFFFSCLSAYEMNCGEGLKLVYGEESVLKESSSLDFQKGKREEYFFEGRQTQVQIEVLTNIDESTANSFSQGERLMIQNLYREKATPYRGQITEVIKCNQKMALRQFKLLINGNDTEVLEGFTNERKAFGICQIENSTYRGTYFSLYNKDQKKLLKMKVFFPITFTHEDIVKFLSRLKVKSW